MASAKKTPKIYSKSKYWSCKYTRNNNLLGKLYVCYFKDKVCLLNLKGEKSKGGWKSWIAENPSHSLYFQKTIDLKDIWEHALSAHQSLLLRVSDTEHIYNKLKSKTLCWLKI